MVNLDSIVREIQRMSEEHGVTYLDTLKKIEREILGEIPKNCGIDNGEIFNIKTGETISNPYEEYLL